MRRRHLSVLLAVVAATALSAVLAISCSGSNDNDDNNPTTTALPPAPADLGTAMAVTLDQLTGVTIAESTGTRQTLLLEMRVDAAGNIVTSQDRAGTVENYMRVGDKTYQASGAGDWTSGGSLPDIVTGDGLYDPFAYNLGDAAPSFADTLAGARNVQRVELDVKDPDDLLFGLSGTVYRVTVTGVDGLSQLDIAFDSDRIEAARATWDSKDGTRTVVYRYRFDPVDPLGDPTRPPESTLPPVEGQMFDSLAQGAVAETMRLLDEIDGPLTADRIGEAFATSTLPRAGYTYEKSTLRVCTEMFPDACAVITLADGTATVTVAPAG